MSKARDEYYSKCYKEGCDWKEDAINYIEELEKSDKQNIIIIGEYALRIDRLEQQRAELIEFAKEMREIGKLNPDRLPEYTDIIYHHANDLITRITGGER